MDDLNYCKDNKCDWGGENFNETTGANYQNTESAFPPGLLFSFSLFKSSTCCLKVQKCSFFSSKRYKEL